MRPKVFAGLLALVLLPALAACGGGGGKSSAVGGAGGVELIAASDVIPASAPVVIGLDTDFDSGQAKTLTDLLEKFPGRQKLYDSITKSLGAGSVKLDDVKAALGPETDIAFLDTGGTSNNPDLVLLTKPKDEAKLQQLLSQGKSKGVSEKVGDWTVVADSQALIDRFKAAGSKLADDPAYKEAVTGLPEDRLATIFLTGAGVKSALKSSQQSQASQASSAVDLEWLALSANATEDGIGLDFRLKSPTLKPANFKSELLGQIPGGSLAALVFKGGDFTFGKVTDLPQVKKLERQTGVTAEQFADLFAGEGTLFIRTGAPIPEITIAVNEANAGSALTTLDTIVSKLSKTAPTTEHVPGVGSVKKVAVQGQPISIYYGTVAGKLIVTTATTGFTALQSPGQTLGDDPVFKEVEDAAGLPEENSGFVYLNLKDLVPLVLGLAQVSNTKIDPAVSENLAPLRSLLIYASADGSVLSARGFLQIK